MSGHTEKTLRSLVDEFNEIPLHRFLGVEVRRYGQGRASSAMHVGPNNTEPNGVVGEAALVSLAMVASRFALHTLIAQGRHVVPLEQDLRCLAPCDSGRLIAKAKVESLWARIGQCEFQIFDEKGEIVAKGHLLAYLLPREQVRSWDELKCGEMRAPALLGEDSKGGLKRETQGKGKETSRVGKKDVSEDVLKDMETTKVTKETVTKETKLRPGLEEDFEDEETIGYD